MARRVRHVVSARIICKFHAAMLQALSLVSSPHRLAHVISLAVLLAGLSLAPQALAERADRFEKLKVEADRQGKIDLVNNLVVFDGNVIVSKGTMLIRAERVELRETPGGYYTAVAFGGSGKAASFKQKREGVEETIEGEAERIEYEGRTETVRFINRASVRRLRGAAVADEISGNLVSYNSLSEVFSVSGGPSATTGAEGGRVRAVLTPRESAPPADEDASQPAPQLKLSPTTGEQR